MFDEYRNLNIAIKSYTSDGRQLRYTNRQVLSEFEELKHLATIGEATEKLFESLGKEMFEVVGIYQTSTYGGYGPGKRRLKLKSTKDLVKWAEEDSE